MTTITAQSPSNGYVLARRGWGLPPLYLLCKDRARNRKVWSSHRQPWVMSLADAVQLEPLLELIVGELFCKPVESVRVPATDKGHEKKIGITFGIVEVSRSGDLCYAELLTRLRHKDTPNFGGMHQVTPPAEAH